MPHRLHEYKSFHLRVTQFENVNNIDQWQILFNNAMAPCWTQIFNKTKYFRLRLSDEVGTERSETDLRLTWDWPMWERWRISALDKLVPDGQTDRVTPWAPDGAKKKTHTGGNLHLYTVNWCETLSPLITFELRLRYVLRFVIINHKKCWKKKFVCNYNKQSKHLYIHTLLLPPVGFRCKYR